MKLPLSWLREYVDVDLSIPELAAKITDAIAEVEGWETFGGDWDPNLVRVATVLRVEPHPNADRLRLATVDAGEGERTVVCGAPNVAAGQKVAFASEGAVLVDGHTGQVTKLKRNSIRGVESAGMVLSEKELGLSEEHEGILVLPPDAPVGRPLVEQLGDVVFDVSTWANRADLLGVYGLAREVAALLRLPLRELETSHAEGDQPATAKVEVVVEAPDLCRRFTASVIEGVTVGPSPQWLQDRLRRMGQRPINNIVDITNYVMLETGQPLHAFDYDLVRGKRIEVRTALPGERLTTLDDVDRELTADMLMICDAEGPTGLAGIMGGGASEVHAGTTNVLLEIANFTPATIRRTTAALKLRTEASLRFEKGIGPETPAHTQHRALHLIEQIAGGTVAAGLIDVYPSPLPLPSVGVSNARVEKVLGITVPEAEVRRILEALGFTVAVQPEGYTVTPPYWRPDVLIHDDVIEEIGRIYGYDRIPPTMLRGTLPAPEPRPVEDLRERIRDIAVGLGFYEVINYSLVDERILNPVVDGTDELRNRPMKAVNPVASQHRMLRTSLRGSVLQSFAANLRRHQGALRLFEAGVEYLPTEADLPHERPVICAVLGGSREDRWARASGDALDFYDASGALGAILDSLGVEFALSRTEEFGFLAGHTATIQSGKQALGLVGQVHPGTAAGFDIDEPVFLLEMWLEDLARVIPDRPAYTPPSRHPIARIDVALLIDIDAPAAEVLRLVRSHRARDIRVDADIFDDYRGPGLPEGKRSLAIELRLQSDDRTLTDADIAKVRNALLGRLERELGAILRA